MADSAHACKAAPGAGFRGKQHVGAGGDHDPGAVGPSRRGLRSQSAIAWRGSRDLSRKFHRCPGLRDDPAGFLAFVEKLLAARHFDVLLPIHEQGFLFARVRQRLEDRVGLALPDFASYRAAHSKAGFSRLLDQLGLPQPATRIVKSERELRDGDPVSLRRQDLGRHRQPRHLVRAQRRPISKPRCESSSAQRTARSPTRCWCRISSRARPRRRKPCFAAAD